MSAEGRGVDSDLEAWRATLRTPEQEQTDRDVARLVFGEEVSERRCLFLKRVRMGDETRVAGWTEIPRYSSRIEDAWKVVERMREQGWAFMMCDWANPLGDPTDDPLSGAVMHFNKLVDGRVVRGRTNGEKAAGPEGICRAALNACAALAAAPAAGGEGE